MQQICLFEQTVTKKQHARTWKQQHGSNKIFEPFFSDDIPIISLIFV